MPPLTSAPVLHEISETLRASGCVFADDEARLLLDAAIDSNELAAMVAQRVAGVPLEHVVGWAEFCGRRIAVTPGVFIPRRRSEFLAEQAVALLRNGDIVVDLCCGSGAIATVLQRASSVEVYASDIDADAAACARINLDSSGAVYVGDLFDPLPATLKGQVNVVVANVPYVPTDSLRLMPYEARTHERATALDGGADGLDLLRRVSCQAPEWLLAGGHLLMETGEDQLDDAFSVVASSGMTARVATSEAFAAQVVIGTKPG